MRKPLKFEVHGPEDAPNYFRLYECEHITDGTHPISPLSLSANVIPIGSHSNLVLCKHCWQHVRGMVAEEVIREAVHQKSIEEIWEMIKKPGEKV